MQGSRPLLIRKCFEFFPKAGLSQLSSQAISLATASFAGPGRLFGQAAAETIGQSHSLHGNGPSWPIGLSARFNSGSIRRSHIMTLAVT